MRAANAAGLSMAALLCLGPLELRDGVALGPLSLTTTELIAALAAITALAARLWAREPVLPTEKRLRWAMLALAAWGLVHLSSALWASADRGHVVKAALRICGQVGLAGLALLWAPQAVFRRRVVMGALAGLGIITLLGVGERLIGRQFEFVLLQFRDEPTWMLGEQRLSTVFYHANTCAAYLELTVPLLLGVALAPGRSRKVRILLLIWAGIAALLLSVTYSRAGLIAAAVGSMALAVAGRRMPQPRLWTGIALTWGTLVVLAYVANPDMRARVGLTERSYRPVYKFQAPCVGHPGDKLRIPLQIRNRGEWDLANRQAPAQFVHTWLTSQGKRLVDDWERTRLPDLPAGATVTVGIGIELPNRPGDFVLAGDILRDRVLRVSGVGAPMAYLGCRVVPAGEPLPVNAEVTVSAEHLDTVRSYRSLDLERRHYWRAAILLWARKPWLGWGSDRFSLIHREYVPSQGYDPRARAHSIWLETGVDLGWLGIAALLGWVAAVVVAIRLAFRRGWASDHGTAVAIAAGLCAFAVHSCVDFFLAYTQMAVIFWPLVGLLLGLSTTATAQSASVSRGDDDDAD